MRCVRRRSFASRTAARRSRCWSDPRRRARAPRARARSARRGRAGALAATSRETMVGSITHSPSSMRRSASAVTATSEMRSLSKVARAFGNLLEEPGGVAPVRVVREHEHSHARVAADLVRREQAVIAVVGRHADVPDGDVGAAGFDRLGGVAAVRANKGAPRVDARDIEELRPSLGTRSTRSGIGCGRGSSFPAPGQCGGDPQAARLRGPPARDARCAGGPVSG